MNQSTTDKSDRKSGTHDVTKSEPVTAPVVPSTDWDPVNANGPYADYGNNADNQSEFPTATGV